MAKLTLDQKITKVTEQITKEEKNIEESKERIKKLNAELKALQTEKDHSFANDIIKLMKANGLSQEQLLAQLKAQATNDSSSALSSLSDDNTSGSSSSY
ncbi:hypothetical protein [Ruminococcus sp. XPD3002]|uniref:hypothetical protein n=1 Tax=Ruminococcus sp. XPD3002 TaxID=1452269 RepID=UPI000910A295|nr:hypothetical protein SAMN04487832_1383 [Ruminococcus flavefaciens]